MLAQLCGLASFTEVLKDKEEIVALFFTFPRHPQQMPACGRELVGGKREGTGGWRGEEGVDKDPPLLACSLGG